VAVLAPVQAWPAVAGYEVLGVLGRGSEGVVYKARQRALGRVVALKMVRGCDADQLRRIRRGAELLARLNHPNIVQVYEVGVHEDLPFFALEYVAGGSLARWLTGQPLPAALVAALMEAVARGVHAGHQAGVVHRDLKPGNILLQIADCGSQIESQSAIRNLQSAIPKVGDFGLARPLAPEESLTAKGAVLGTPEYMPPEQAQGGAAGPACDVYALGAILYRLMTGRPPFVGERPMDVLLQVVHDEPLPPRRLQPKVARDLETVCLQCLRKEPSRRYASAEALADDLARVRRGEPVRARRAGLLERGLRWARRHPAATGLIAACTLLLAVSGFGAVWYLRGQAAEAQRRQDTNQAVVLALGKARLLRDQARQAPLGDGARFREALVVAENAAELARTGGTSEEVRQQAESLRRELQGEATTADADRRLVAALLEVRGPREGPRFRANDKGALIELPQPSADEQFAAAFRAWGLEVDRTPTAEAAARLQARPATLVTEVVAALDEWANERRQQTS
jgi:serine/threonine-protein kinase